VYTPLQLVDRHAVLRWGKDQTSELQSTSVSKEQHAPEQNDCSDWRRLAASDVEVERSAREHLEVDEGASRLRVDREQVETDTRRRQLAGCHAVERVNFAVAEILRRYSDALGEPSGHAGHW